VLRQLYRTIAALLFAVSLVYAGYVFAIVWEDAAPAAGRRLAAALAVNTIGFTLFAGHHSLLARTRVKQRLSTVLREDDQRTLFVWAASLLLIAVLVSWREIGHVIYTAPAGAAFVLRGLRLFGVVLVVQAVRVIDPLELAGLRPPRGTLEIRGPYRWVRHPVYLGFLLAVWTPVTMTGDRMTFAVLATVYLVLAIPLEERSMQRKMGGAYDAYRARVRWRVAPGIY
jgi:protein-S-isoprenylcysteine O-methyltransferase Ste14